MTETTYSLQIKTSNDSDVTKTFTFSPANPEATATQASTFVAAAKVVYGDSTMYMTAANLIERKVTDLLTE